MTEDEARLDRQAKFAAEQAKTSRELDRLHRRMHPEMHPATNRKGPNR